MKFIIQAERIGDLADEIDRITIYVGTEVATRLLRLGDCAPSDFLLAPAGFLAEWLVSNWWRLTCEPRPSGQKPELDGADPGWRLAHDLRAVGHGYAWPRMAICGDGERINVISEPDPIGVVGPVRFLSRCDLDLQMSDFESGAEQFLDQLGGRDKDLRQAIAELQAEQCDPESSAWRRLEAKLGFDPDQVPDSLMREMGDLAGTYGNAAIEEAASAKPGTDAAATLKQGIEAAKTSGLRFQSEARIPVPSGDLVPAEPWQLGEQLANMVRENLGRHGPLSDEALGDLMKLPSAAFADSQPLPIDYGLRVGDRVLARSEHCLGRRFEFARALGDFLFVPGGNGNALGPIAASKTTRQKVQRAFAAGLLCPLSDLEGYLGTTNPDEYDIAAAAQHFRVSERLILTTLVNNGRIERESFEQMIEVV